MRLLVAGATGLVGAHVVERALSDPRITAVVAPTRRPLPRRERLLNPVVDFRALPADAQWWQVDAVVLALGTTRRKARSRAAFRAVDLVLTVRIAELARAGGARACALVSAVGAGPRAAGFYLRTKYETEEAVRMSGFPSLTIARPSLIGGDRAEVRPLERMAERALRVLGPLVPARFRITPVERIAEALLEHVTASAPGVAVLEPV